MRYNVMPLSIFQYLTLAEFKEDVPWKDGTLLMPPNHVTKQIPFIITIDLLVVWREEIFS